MPCRLAHSSAIGLLLVAALIAACGEDCSPTAPGAPSPAPLFALGDQSPSPLPQHGEIQLCTTGDVAGVFSLDGVAVGTVVTDGAYIGTPTINSGTCVVVARNNGTGENGGRFTITQTSPVTVPSISGQFIGSAGPPTPFVYTQGVAMFVNDFNGYSLTFRNGVQATNGCGQRT